MFLNRSVIISHAFWNHTNEDYAPYINSNSTCIQSGKAVDIEDG